MHFYYKNSDRFFSKKKRISYYTNSPLHTYFLFAFFAIAIIVAKTPTVIITIAITAVVIIIPDVTSETPISLRSPFVPDLFI